MTLTLAKNIWNKQVLHRTKNLLFILGDAQNSRVQLFFVPIVVPLKIRGPLFELIQKY